MAYDFKRPEDVIEYLKNLHIEYKFGCFSEKKPEVCHLLGEFKEVIKKEHEVAREIFKNNCDTFNYPLSCTKYGDYLCIGKGGKEDRREGYKYLQKGCDMKDMNACFHLGVMILDEKEPLTDNTTIEAETAKATKMMELACTSRVEKACTIYAEYLMKGMSGRIERNPMKALDYFMKSCDLLNRYSCGNAAALLLGGHGVPRDVRLAEKLKSKAIELDKEKIEFQRGI